MTLAPQVIVRPARLADARDIAALHHVSVHRLAAGFYPREVLERWSPQPSLGRAERLYREAQAEGAMTLVAELHGQIVGFGIVHPTRDEISACYVAPEQARRGVGHTLLTAMELTLAGAGRHVIRVRAALNARSFYTALGYQVTGRGEHVFDDGTRMVVTYLEKDLSPLGLIGEQQRRRHH
ncbi:GNAT family N-acetyltransferase [Devosia sp. ZB163]|uniref:GNAT family N-acetyltransferase n=1 Tax=Devosia sp. ZB163 TaxID=3025938 RepID=UPI0023601126|nr:GNAT family N-acetyltransferase [Devosia sp. ZB163]MDC9822817.1 GNAT family N-acetyltransferase [Devosia sp. ZB163]